MSARRPIDRSLLRAAPAALLITFLVVAWCRPVAAQATGSTPPRRNVFTALLSIASWEDVGRLAPVPGEVDFISTGPGSFATTGYGLELSYHRRLTRAGRRGLLVGADLGGSGHPSRLGASVIDAINGETDRVSLRTTLNYVTGSARLDFHEPGRSGFHVLGGAGLYVFNLSESWERAGDVDTGGPRATPGGFLGGGFVAGKGRVVFRADARVHVFSFGSLGPTLPGQKASGPVGSILLGADF